MKTFIEIGTSDFDTLIPLAKQGWKGIFVEPVGYLLDNLERIEGCVYLKAAIGDYNGEAEIEYVKNPEEEWERGVNSLVGEVHAKLFDYRDTIIEKTKIMKLDNLIDTYNIKKIDFLKIDIEGIEWKILQDYSFKIKPSVIKCEYKHWDEGKYDSIIPRLESIGYLVYKETDDFYAII